jgi:hypothetical protein
VKHASGRVACLGAFATAQRRMLLMGRTGHPRYSMLTAASDASAAYFWPTGSGGTHTPIKTPDHQLPSDPPTTPTPTHAHPPG